MRFPYGACYFTVPRRHFLWIPMVYLLFSIVSVAFFGVNMLFVLVWSGMAFPVSLRYLSFPLLFIRSVLQAPLCMAHSAIESPPIPCRPL